MTFGSTYVSPAKSYLIFRVNNMAKKEFYKIELPNGNVVELKNGVNRQGNRGVEVYRDGKKVCFVGTTSSLRTTPKSCTGIFKN